MDEIQHCHTPMNVQAVQPRSLLWMTRGCSLRYSPKVAAQMLWYMLVKKCIRVNEISLVHVIDFRQISLEHASLTNVTETYVLA